MKESLRTGITFGLTSAVITTLGLMVGLYAGTNSRLVVLGGIITIAIADAFSDALGIHVSEEARSENSHRDVWEATLATFAAKFLFALTFVVPVLLLPLDSAVLASFVWGMAALAVLSYFIARIQQEQPWKVIGEHLLIALVVIAITHWVGLWVATLSV
jgi:vacuolar iron transporter family protein